MPYLLKKLRSNKRTFYRGTNIITNSQLAFRIASNAKTLSVIAILSATTLSSIGAIGSLYYNVNKNAEKQVIASFEYMVPTNQKTADKILRTANSDKTHSVTFEQETALYHVKLDSSAPKIDESLADEGGFQVMKQSDYMTLFKAFYPKETTPKIGTDEALLIPSIYVGGRDDLIKPNRTVINLNGKATPLHLKYSNHSVIQSIFAGTLILPDTQAAKITQKPSMKIQSIQVKNPKTADTLSDRIQEVLPKDTIFQSYPAVYRSMMNTAGVLMFIGMFIGLVFLAATGSIIYFKQLTEAYNDVGTYGILKKIGVTRKEIRYSIAKQVLVIFLIPLVLGIAHSSIALVCLSKMLDLDLTLPVVISTASYTVMYIIYYLVTVNSYTNIVMGKRLK
ncbi:ABC transporter permease [Listeria floridensis FSL S10-1187]|uniref:ABC transporter permease n=1 Tax=Listeria floridensis FSL S10-1187 TaxID=1265817 RepID=A0ABN0RHW5_9LIST|nr:ABC transporter permease [Listeria floridensis]EUJ33503.1 ABC transporter permease [Listeria floridensis FSL S10-1187]